MKISYVLLSVLLWEIPSCFSDGTIQEGKHQGLSPEQSYIYKQTKEKLKDLCIASRLGNIDAVKRIVNTYILAATPKDGVRIDINALDEEGCPPLIHACEEAQENIVAYLLTIPTISLKVTKTDGTTPLIAACDCENIEKIKETEKQARTAIVRNILKTAKNRNIKLYLNTTVQKLGWTALMFASFSGIKEIVVLLVKNGAAVDRIDTAGLTAVDLARTDEIKQLLLSTKQIR